MTIKEQILDLSRQNNIGALSPWFDAALNLAITDDHFHDTVDLAIVRDKIIEQLTGYREETGKAVVVLGMSGGVDSALTAALFKEAGWEVLGVTMPILQNPEETERGVEACMALGIKHLHKDLSDLFLATIDDFRDIDADLTNEMMLPKDVKIRLGNIRARLRMVTLYNLASLNNGIVASTDNFSELTAGFWTKHGDVGDVSPIQSLLKSWEVPYLSKLMGVPESTYRATPTDGLGIDAGDEAQLGASYLEWDLMVLAIHDAMQEDKIDRDEIRDYLDLDDRGQIVFENVMRRIKGSWFKRMDPVNLQHAFHDRYAIANEIDGPLRPMAVRGFEFLKR